MWRAISTSGGDMTQDSITFQAIFYKAQTVIDGGIRISLDISPDQAQAMVELIKLQGRILEVAIVPHPKESDYV